MPHQLMMSATPIPRTLSMSYYADLDVSVIDELPPGPHAGRDRLVVDARRDEVLARMRDACAEGAQAYWVCPLIEESEALQLQDRASRPSRRSPRTCPSLRVGLVHGRLKADEKAAVMAAFVADDIAAAGGDHGDRGGRRRAQRHADGDRARRALRPGATAPAARPRRPRRREAPASCSTPSRWAETARARLKVIYENSDGFEIARQDLQLRGPGEFLGERQSGLPLLRYADLERRRAGRAGARGRRGAAARRSRRGQRHLERWLGGRSRTAERIEDSRHADLVIPSRRARSLASLADGARLAVTSRSRALRRISRGAAAAGPRYPTARRAPGWACRRRTASAGARSAALLTARPRWCSPAASPAARPRRCLARPARTGFAAAGRACSSPIRASRAVRSSSAASTARHPLWRRASSGRAGPAPGIVGQALSVLRKRGPCW